MHSFEHYTSSTFNIIIKNSYITEKYYYFNDAFHNNSKILSLKFDKNHIILFIIN